MAAVFSTSTGGITGKIEKLLIVMLATGLHILLIYQIAHLSSAPAISQPQPSMTLELALTAPSAETSVTASAPSLPEIAPPAENLPQQDMSKQDRPKQQETSPVDEFAMTPPKPVEKHVEPERAIKPQPKRPDKQPTPPAQRKAAPGALMQNAATTQTTAKSSANGVMTPASANAAHLNNPAPRYPALALKRKWQGTVQLRVRVLTNGRPNEILIARSSGRDLLDQAAVAAVRQWSFIPAKKDGVPQESWTTFPLSFKLQ
ncbi:energy transducer TonB [Brenneria roseae subsp. americana]|uniref:Energy transducer TonB n=1 Tax=Brenneria roseae subsp. americana TaxID=1508507 RepID=A0A2U1TNA9_9GAMM|nr:energy transducer TonB [Brenneria roseae]PWC10897.1 energy transducer TonB [Brenneria roseae subsp. americana]